MSGTGTAYSGTRSAAGGDMVTIWVRPPRISATPVSVRADTETTSAIRPGETAHGSGAETRSDSRTTTTTTVGGAGIRSDGSVGDCGCVRAMGSAVNIAGS